MIQCTVNETNDVMLVINERNVFRFPSEGGEFKRVKDDLVYHKGKLPEFDEERIAQIVADIEQTVDPLTEKPIGKLSEADIEAVTKALEKPVHTDKQTALSQKAKGR